MLSKAITRALQKHSDPTIKMSEDKFIASTAAKCLWHELRLLCLLKGKKQPFSLLTGCWSRAIMISSNCATPGKKSVCLHSAMLF